MGFWETISGVKQDLFDTPWYRWAQAIGPVVSGINPAIGGVVSATGGYGRVRDYPSLLEDWRNNFPAIQEAKAAAKPTVEQIELLRKYPEGRPPTAPDPAQSIAVPIFDAVRQSYDQAHQNLQSMFRNAPNPPQPIWAQRSGGITSVLPPKVSGQGIPMDVLARLLAQRQGPLF